MSEEVIVFEADRLASCLAALPTDDPCASPWSHQEEAEKAVVFALTERQIIAVRRFGLGLYPWIVVRTGVDLSALPNTPIGFAPIAHPGWWPIAWIAAGMMSLAGARVVSYECENDGHAFVNLVATLPEAGEVRVSEKSISEMRGHTDAVSFPFPSEFQMGGEPHSPAPDLLVLVGLRNPRRTPTRLAPVSEVLSKLTESEEGALAGPFFDIQAQKTFNTENVRLNAPLLSRIEANGRAFRFSHSNITVAADAPSEASSALQRFKDLLPESYKNVVIGPGDICLVQNRLVVHGRGAPGEGFGGDTRWLLRTYGWASATSGGHHATGMAPHVHQ
jgi:L-asparagine oxygenase